MADGTYTNKASALASAFRVRLEMERLKQERDRQVAERRHDFAGALLSLGLTLIPSEHLNDHEMAVSREVYNAAIAIACGAIRKEADRG